MIKITILRIDGIAEEKTIEGGDKLIPNLQSELGGYLEPLRYVDGVPKGKILLVDEDGLMKELPLNPWIQGGGIVGPIIMMNDADLN